MTQINTALVPEINQSLEIQLPLTISGDELRKKLASHVNELINHDFEKLVFNLYRIDVNEARMRALLAQKDGENAATLIADLIIERQLQKIKSRQQIALSSGLGDRLSLPAHFPFEESTFEIICADKIALRLNILCCTHYQSVLIFASCSGWIFADIQC